MVQLFFTLKNKWYLIHTSKSGAKFIITDKGEKRYITSLLKKKKAHRKCKSHKHKGGWYMSIFKGGCNLCMIGGWGCSSEEPFNITGIPLKSR